MDNVSLGLEKHCSGCGLCECLCPVGAINIRENEGFFRPIIDDSCNGCGKCRKHCPNLQLNINIGRYGDFTFRFWGHSNTENNRKEAASGGVASEFLHYLLDKGLVDYAVVAEQYHNDRRNEFVIIEADHADAVFQNMGSRYCPVNMGRAIGEIRKRKGTCAIVCLPCLARGIEILKKTDDALRDRIKYVVSLLCNHTPSYEATEYLMKKYKQRKASLIKYRGDGWFGNLRIYENGTEVFSVPFSEYFGTKFSEYFWQESCVNCVDHFGREADICVGDADFIKYRNPQQNNMGETMCFSNNEEIIAIFHQMKREKIISLYEDTTNDELKSIYGDLENACRANSRNLKSGYMKILSEEKRWRYLKFAYIFYRRLHGLATGRIKSHNEDAGEIVGEQD